MRAILTDFRFPIPSLTLFIFSFFFSLYTHAGAEGGNWKMQQHGSKNKTKGGQKDGV
jgi:hypothetical protein